jgi:hypothetical protein
VSGDGEHAAWVDIPAGQGVAVGDTITQTNYYLGDQRGAAQTKPLEMEDPPLSPTPNQGPTKPRVSMPRSWLVGVIFIMAAINVSLVMVMAGSRGSPQASPPTQGTPIAAQTSATSSPTTEAAIPAPSSPNATSTITGNSGPTVTGTTPIAGVPSTDISTDPGNGGFKQVVNLSDLNPVDKHFSLGPDIGTAGLGSANYPNSITLHCGSFGGDYITYDVAGYSTLDATVGVPNDFGGAIGRTGTVTFFGGGARQLGQPLTVSLDHPQRVHIDLPGGSQLKITCAGYDTTAHASSFIDVVLGSATLSSS